MSAIIELAEQLGKAIADSPAARGLRDARAGLNQQPAVLKLLQEFQAQSDKIGQLEEANKPIEAQDKQKLQALHEQLIGNEVFKKYTMAQMEYVDLLRKVNQALDAQLGTTEQEE